VLFLSPAALISQGVSKQLSFTHERRNSENILDSIEFILIPSPPPEKIPFKNNLGGGCSIWFWCGILLIDRCNLCWLGVPVSSLPLQPVCFTYINWEPLPYYYASSHIRMNRTYVDSVFVTVSLSSIRKELPSLLTQTTKPS
jgi:hypothetical protein